MQMITFVTDPDDPLVTPLLSKLLSLVDNEFQEESLDRNLVKYSFQDLDGFQDIINLISYEPITVISNNDNMIELIKVLTERIIKTEISNVEITRFKNYYVYNPITVYGTPVYENPSYLNDFYKKLNMDYLETYQVLSEDPIVKYIIYEKNIKNVIFVDNVALIPIGNNINEINYYSDIVNETSIIIDTQRKQGVFTYSIDIHNPENSNYLKELIQSWKTEILYESEDTLVLKTDIDFGVDPELWFRNSVELTRKGQFPEITLYGDWQFKTGGDYNDIYDKKWYSSIIYYSSLLAYKRLNINNIIIKVNNDNSITLSLPMYDHVVEFKKYFNEIISSEDIYAEPCQDLIDGIIKRYYVQSIDDKAYPIIYKQIYDDNTTEEVLVFRSPLLNNYPPVFTFNVNQEEITNKIREYYQKCHDNYEPVLLEEIKRMDIYELLNLIEVTENGITYCYSSSTIMNLTDKKNPMTRQPLDKNILMKASRMEWSLRGIFDTGPLKGLLQ